MVVSKSTAGRKSPKVVSKEEVEKEVDVDADAGDTPLVEDEDMGGTTFAVTGDGEDLLRSSPIVARIAPVFDDAEDLDLDAEDASPSRPLVEMPVLVAATAPTEADLSKDASPGTSPSSSGGSSSNNSSSSSYSSRDDSSSKCSSGGAKEAEVEV